MFVPLKAGQSDCIFTTLKPTLLEVDLFSQDEHSCRKSLSVFV